MKILSDYTWPEAGMSGCVQDTLLLKQVRTGESTILFACICQETVSGNSTGEKLPADGRKAGQAGGYMTERLAEWFYKKGLLLCRKDIKDKRIKQELLSCISRAAQELKQFGQKYGNPVFLELTCCLLMNNRFWLLNSGGNKVFVLNRRFQRAHIRQIRFAAGNIGESERIPEIVCGGMQKGLGILLCTRDFLSGLDEMEIEQCLAVADITTQIQIRKRLKEIQLHGRSERPAGSAICFVMPED